MVSMVFDTNTRANLDIVLVNLAFLAFLMDYAMNNLERDGQPLEKYSE